MPQRLTLALPLLLCLTGCTLGLQQSMLVPPVQGTWHFSGVDLTAGAEADTGEPLAFDVQMPGDSGRIDSVRTATQLMLGLDVPFARASVAVAVDNDPNLDLIEMNLLYKHELFGDDPTWQWMGGLTLGILESRVETSQSLVLTDPITVDGLVVRNGDVVRYQAADMRTGFYATFGIERELADWLHIYVQLNALLTESADRGEDLTLTTHDDSGNEDQTLHLLTDNRFQVNARESGSMSSTIEMPAFTGLVGISVTWPTFSSLKRRPADVQYRNPSPYMDTPPAYPSPQPYAPQPTDPTLQPR
jgi:hypothetical protein